MTTGYDDIAEEGRRHIAHDREVQAALSARDDQIAAIRGQLDRYWHGQVPTQAALDEIGRIVGRP